MVVYEDVARVAFELRCIIMMCFYNFVKPTDVNEGGGTQRVSILQSNRPANYILL